MEVQQRLYDIDDLWRIVCQPENADKHIERDIIGQDGALSGEAVLPGFTLELALLFS